MSRQDNINLIYLRIDKGQLNEKSLTPIFEFDTDFCENEDEYRDDTLELGFRSEGERISKEIFDTCNNSSDERSVLNDMIERVFKVNNFIGDSSYYGTYTSNIIETDFEYIINIAFNN